MKIESRLPLSSTRFSAKLIIEAEGEDLSPQELLYISNVTQSILKSVDKTGGLTQSITPRGPYTKRTTSRYPQDLATLKSLYKTIIDTPIDKRVELLSEFGVTNKARAKGYLQEVRNKIKAMDRTVSFTQRTTVKAKYTYPPANKMLKVYKDIMEYYPDDRVQLLSQYGVTNTTQAQNWCTLVRKKLQANGEL